MIRVSLGLIFVLLLKGSSISHKSSDLKRRVLSHSGVLFASLILVTIGNLSGTLFLPAFLVLIAILLSRERNESNFQVLILAVSLGPFFILLIPYPNYSFHVPIIVYLFLKTLETQNRFFSGAVQVQFQNFVLVCILFLAFLLKERTDIENLTRFTSQGVSFVSYDQNWGEALRMYNEGKACTTFACWYFLLNSDKNIQIFDYPGIHEKNKQG
jgi:hypothetical protein